METKIMTLDELEAAGEVSHEEAGSRRRYAVQLELDELDRKSARALRSVVAGTATDADKARLVELEAEAVALRVRLAELG